MSSCSVVSRNPSMFYEFHYKLAKVLVRLHVSPEYVSERIAKDLVKNGRQIKFKFSRTSLRRKQNFTTNEVYLITYLLSRWANERIGNINQRSLGKLFEDRPKVKFALQKLCVESIGSLRIGWTACRKMPVLEISKEGKLFAYCKVHDMKRKGWKRTHKSWCYYWDPEKEEPILSSEEEVESEEDISGEESDPGQDNEPSHALAQRNTRKRPRKFVQSTSPKRKCQELLDTFSVSEAKETRQRKPILRAKTRSREHTSSTRRCPNCYRPVDEQHRALSCVGCRFWFHQTCAHLSDKVFKEYVSHSYTKFRCNNCCPDTVKDPDPETETEKPSSAQSSEQSTTLDPGEKQPTLRELRVLKTREGKRIDIIKHIAPKWENFGVFMDFDDKGLELDRIAAENKVYGNLSCCVAMFKHWLADGRRQTWNELVEMLEDADGYGDLAKDVKECIRTI